MGQRDREYISCLLTEEILKVAQLKISASASKVENLSLSDIKGKSDEEIKSELERILSGFKLSKSKARAVCVVPPSMTITKNIEIPSLEPKEIESIIDLQAGRHTPYSREEIVIGYINFGVYQKNYSKILLVIVNRQVIMRQINILESVGVKVEKIFFAPEVKSGFYAKTLGVFDDQLPVGIIDVNSTFTDFTIMLRGIAIACRSIPVGAKDIIDEGEEAKKRFVEELKQSVESYQSEDIEKIPQKYVLAKKREMTDGIKDLAAATLGASFEILSYDDSLVFSDKAKKVFDENNAESFLDVLSPSLAYDGRQIDLLPEEIKTQRIIEKQGQEGIKFGALAIILLVLSGAIFISKIYFKSSLLEKIQTQYNETERAAGSLEKISTKTRIIKGYLESRLVPLDVVEELYRIIPDDIYLKSFVLDENGKISIDGTSDSMSQVFALVGTLEDSGIFKGVKTKSTTAKKERGKDVASFEIVFMLESAEDGDEEELEEEQIAEAPAETTE
ncbi:MAG: pilus assembly protein PilM [Candidatus Aceula lacicola]|nr:pilus assembly protein PilM [Candidatus Aceula lacicola]